MWYLSIDINNVLNNVFFFFYRSCVMDPQENTSQEEVSRRQNTRGATRMSRVARITSQGELLDIEIDRFCVYHGVNRPTFASHLGYLVRKHMPLGYKTWKEVPVEDKNILYDRITVNSITCFIYLL